MSERTSFWGGITRFLTAEGIGFLLQAAIKPLIPVLLAAATLASSIVEDLPLWLLLPLTAIAFAGGIVGVNGIDTFFAKRAFKGLFAVGDVQAVQALSQDGLTVIGYDLYLLMVNYAEVPVEYQMDEVTADLDTRVLPQRLPTKLLGGLVHRAQQRWHCVGSVVFKPNLDSAHMRGNMRVRLRYGREGREFGWKSAEKKFEYQVQIDALGFVEATRAFER